MTYDRPAHADQQARYSKKAMSLQRTSVTSVLHKRLTFGSNLACRQVHAFSYIPCSHSMCQHQDYRLPFGRRYPYLSRQHVLQEQHCGLLTAWLTVPHWALLSGALGWPGTGTSVGSRPSWSTPQHGPQNQAPWSGTRGPWAQRSPATATGAPVRRQHSDQAPGHQHGRIHASWATAQTSASTQAVPSMGSCRAPAGRPGMLTSAFITLGRSSKNRTGPCRPPAGRPGMLTSAFIILGGSAQNPTGSCRAPAGRPGMQTSACLH